MLLTSFSKIQQSTKTQKLDGMPTLMIQGCTSDAGKSTITAALCRLLKRRGISVAPFKPQNMALNSAVTEDGGEIGRSQAVQAVACGIPTHTDMNPVLLKPTNDCQAQVIIQGHSIGNLNALDYHEYKSTARKAVFESWHRLQSQYDWVIVEGAGSPAEVNLRVGDIANMGFAEEADCPVWLVADIDRGGVFAHFVGTLACLSKSEQARIQGFIINRFRGDLSLLQPGCDWLEAKTDKPVLAVVPYVHGLEIAAEDALPRSVAHAGEQFRVVVATLPHISNHTDFDPLRRVSGVECQYAAPNHPLPACDVLIIPGTKNTRGDLAWMREQGWDNQIIRHLRYGGKVIGICGGLQILGHTISDHSGTESEAGESHGLGLIPLSTVLESDKKLAHVQGELRMTGATVTGYEIHVGQSQFSGGDEWQPLLYLNDGSTNGRPEGYVSPDGQIIATYIHGLFDESSALKSLLSWAGFQQDYLPPSSAAVLLEQQIERIADALDGSLLWDRVALDFTMVKAMDPQNNFIDRTSD